MKKTITLLFVLGLAHAPLLFAGESNELTDEIITKVVTGNDLVLASGVHSYPIPKTAKITVIARGDPVESRGIGGTPVGTKLFPVKVTSVVEEPKAGEAQHGSLMDQAIAASPFAHLGPDVRVFWFYQDSFHEWKAVAEPGLTDKLIQLGDTQPTIH